MLCIQEELGQLSAIAGNAAITDSREAQIPNSSHTNSENNSNSSDKCSPGSGSLDSQRSSWVEGILGCMRPVWTMLSKAAVNEKIKGHSSKFLPTCLLGDFLLHFTFALLFDEILDYIFDAYLISLIYTSIFFMYIVSKNSQQSSKIISQYFS